MTPAAQVVILTKPPEPGRVKTRLAPLLGDAGAAAVHAAMVWATLAQVQRAGLPCVVRLDGDPAGDFAAALAARGATVLPQGDGDLGARLRRALAGPGRCIALGTDCPLLEPVWLLAAARDPHPVVLGPAEDGGYWMIAIDAPQDALFEGIPWSTAQVRTATLARAQAAGLAVCELATCYDIDTPADLLRLLADPRCPPEILAAARPHLPSS